MPNCSIMSMGAPFKIEVAYEYYDKYSVDIVWTKIYCDLYFIGITLIRVQQL